MIAVPTLEVPLDSLESAVLAAPYADRLELCDDLASEGWSPTEALVRSVRAAVETELVVMVRPRLSGADTSLTASGFAATARVIDACRADIEMAARAGAESVAIALLTRDGFVDMEACGQLAACARAARLEVAFLRAFDLLKDRERGMRNICALGVQRVVTAGVMGWDASVTPLERRLEVLEVDTAQARRFATPSSAPVEVVAGGGVRWSNALDFLAISPHLHASCRRDGAISREELEALREQMSGSPRP